VGVTVDGWDLTVEAEAEVVPGPLRRVRELAEAHAREGTLMDPAAVLEIVDGAP